MGWKYAGVMVLVAAVAVGCGRETDPKAAASPSGGVVEAAPEVPFTGEVFKVGQKRSLCHGTPAAPSPPGRYADVPYDPAVFLAMQRENMAAKNRAEAPAVLSTRGRVRREGEVLTVSGVRFVDRTREEHNDMSGAYRYLGRVADAPIDVVHGARGESEAWTLVDAGGREVVLAGAPLSSPSGRAFAAAGDDVGGEGLNGLQIADYRDGAFKLVELDAPSACDPRWADDSTLEVKVLPTALAKLADAPERKPSDWRIARVVRDGAGWKLIPPAA